MRLLELLIKGAGHKYIKRIPVGTTKTGKVRYRYIYRADHTVGGKHLLDEAHLKAGTKLMLHSKDGAEVHAHIDSVKGDQVTFTYDDGDRKGETRTVSKQKLLAEFNKENKVGEQITSAKAGLLADIKAAADRGTSKKQLARLVARLERLGGKVEPEQEMPKLAKDLLAKHQVNKEQVFSAFDTFAKPPIGKIDLMYRDRLRGVRQAGADRAVETYNNALEQAAKDNVGVLAAIEAYREATAPKVNIEAANETVERAARLYKENIIEAAILTTYEIPKESRGGLTYKTLRKEGSMLADIIKGTALKDTGIDIKATGQTLEEAYGSARPLETVIQSSTDTAKQAAAEKALQEAVASSCDSFMLAGIRGEGLHSSHRIDVLNKTDERIVLAHADELNKIEQVFQAAYPERADSVDVSLRREKGSRAGAVLMSNMQIVSLPRTHSLRSAAHELAHTLEGAIGGGGGLASAFPYQRAIHEAVTLTHLTRITKGEVSAINSKESAHDDEYHSLYAGKLYRDGSSELVTMGVQEMFKSKEPEQQVKHIAAFAARDPHHFLVTYAVLKGYTKHEK